MASIDDIWDAPVAPNSPKTPRHLDIDDGDDEAQVQRPAKRQKQALFLSDSEDEGEDEGRVKRGIIKAPPPAANPGMDEDVEALFADAENDAALSFKRIGDLDVAAMEREAEERHRRALPLTPHPVMPSSSPARDGGTAGNGAGGSKNDKEKGKDTKKRPRPVPLNENLLLGPTGFPDLISQIKDFKVRGKGRELEDLTRVMRVYNFWTHKLHPKLKFRDTVLRIEKLCHTKRMQVALSVWKDEAHGKPHELDADLSLDSDDDNAGRNTTTLNGGTRTSGNATSEAPSTPHSVPSGQDTDRDRFSLPPSSRASSQPPTSDFPDEDDVFGPSTSSNSRPNGSSATSTSAAAKKRIVVDDNDEEESFWKELEAAQALQPTQVKQQSEPTQSAEDLDDAEMWAALEEATNRSIGRSVQAGSGKGSTAPEKPDEMDIDDDDMWDIIRENEKAPPASRLPATDPTAVATESTLSSHKRPSGDQILAESEMDWDEMYAT
ncbi:Chromosome segregation in meiosis protein 3 [Leucoagaricus sp. SymC.cos]|nr:Chromosome segregation in meiosis protein 3 [Leucoagaricus sp. SymC.cos]